MSGFGRPTTGAIGLGDLAPVTLDPSYLLFSGGSWSYAPPPVGGILNNYSAVTNPGVGNDSGNGYVVGSEWINTATGAVFKLTDATFGAAVWEQINITGSGNEEGVFLDFDFSTVHPALVASLNAGDKIITSEVKIITPFNGVAPTLSLGTPGSPSLIFSATDIAPAKAITHGNPDNFDFAAPDSIQLSLALGGSTAGAGQVLVTIRRA